MYISEIGQLGRAGGKIEDEVEELDVCMSLHTKLVPKQSSFQFSSAIRCQATLFANI